MGEWKDGISYCWDTSVFFAWLKEEQCHPLADIALVVDEINKGNAFLLVPATTYEELHYSRLTDEQKRKFDGVMQRSNVMMVDLSPPIARKSALVMSRSVEAGIVTKVRDARIAATAIVMKATMLHSVDPDLIRLDGSPIVEGLATGKPCLVNGQKGLRI